MKSSSIIFLGCTVTITVHHTSVVCLLSNANDTESFGKTRSENDFFFHVHNCVFFWKMVVVLPSSLLSQYTLGLLDLSLLLTFKRFS